MEKTNRKPILFVRVKIQSHTDRNNMVNALANNGHKVWIETKKSDAYLKVGDYYVCYEPKVEE